MKWMRHEPDRVLYAYEEETLESHVRSRVSRHLDRCSICASRVEDYRQLRFSLLDTIPASTASLDDFAAEAVGHVNSLFSQTGVTMSPNETSVSPPLPSQRAQRSIPRRQVTMAGGVLLACLAGGLAGYWRTFYAGDADEDMEGRPAKKGTVYICSPKNRAASTIRANDWEATMGWVFLDAVSPKQKDAMLVIMHLTPPHPFSAQDWLKEAAVIHRVKGTAWLRDPSDGRTVQLESAYDGTSFQWMNYSGPWKDVPQTQKKLDLPMAINGGPSATVEWAFPLPSGTRFPPPIRLTEEQWSELRLGKSVQVLNIHKNRPLSHRDQTLMPELISASFEIVFSHPSLGNPVRFDLNFENIQTKYNERYAFEQSNWGERILKDLARRDPH
jgi:hypothetical protein